MQKINNIKTAIYNKLNGDATLGALITGIYGKKVKPGVALPYIRFFSVVATPQDSFSEKVTRDLLQVDCYAEDTATKIGSQLVGEISSAVYGALNENSLTITDYESICCQWTATRELDDLEDGDVSRINQEYLIIVHAT